VVTEIPVIMTEHGPLEPLIDYMLERAQARSDMWKVKLAQAVSLLLDYMAANHECFDDTKELFETFAQRLYTGTVGDDGSDPSGLYWSGRNPAQVRQLVLAISAFSDWMAEKLGTRPVNAWRQATRSEEMLAWAAWHQKRHRAFLAHTWDRGKSSLAMTRARNVLLRKTPVVDHDGVKFFPEDRIHDLLFRGFIVPGKQKSPRLQERLNLRDILITLLMHFGGLRMSEPFHLYVHDVAHDPMNSDRAYVRIYHPSLGTAPPDWMDIKNKPTRCNRQEYLRGKFGMRPRDEYASSAQLHAGWKDNALTSTAHFIDVNWFPLWAGELFMKLWVLYLTQRPVNLGHPFAFITKAGTPYSIDAFERQHRRAVERIGLIPAKMLGTTPHGHRHSYGQRLKDADIDPIILKKALHHKSIESQIVYTESERAKLTRLLAEATQRADAGVKLAPPDLLSFGFEDVDPLGLMSGPHPKLLRRK
jgi:hypothetical protein